MLKLSKLLFHSRNQLSQKKLFAEATDGYLWLRGMSTQAGASAARQNFSADGRPGTKIFAPYSIYKGKAALSASPIPPTFSKLDSGAFRVDRRGVIFLTFWPAIGERKYDWDKRQEDGTVHSFLGSLPEGHGNLEDNCNFCISNFALSATEVGSIISLGSKESCEFFHDPSMLSSNAGQIRKSLSIKALDSGNGYFISLNVVNNILKTNDRFVVPVTTAEFAVMRSAFNFALPHIMGWDRYTSLPLRSMDENRPKVASEFLDIEWDR